MTFLITCSYKNMFDNPYSKESTELSWKAVLNLSVKDCDSCKHQSFY